MNTLTNTKPYYFKTLYNNYVTAANEAYDRYDIDKTVKLSLSSLSLNFTFNGSNYESNRITFSGVSNLNITTNVGSIYKSGSTFKVIMPTTSIGASTTVKVTVSASKALEFARNCYCESDTYQTLTTITLNTQPYTNSKEITGTITPEEEPKGTIIIKKYDDNNKYLSGATLVVTGPNSYSKTITTSGSAITLSDLEYGIYAIKEMSAPNGYIIAATQTVTIDDSNQTATVTMIDKITKVRISKTDITGTNELAGAALEIQDTNGNVVNYCNGKAHKWVSTSEPYEIEGIPSGIYYLVQTIAPNGYVLNKEKVKFKVKNDTRNIEVEMVNQLEADVPDTLSGRSTLLIAISMFDIALGIGIITFVKKNKVKDNQ